MPGPCQVKSEGVDGFSFDDYCDANGMCQTGGLQACCAKQDGLDGKCPSDAEGDPCERYRATTAPPELPFDPFGPEPDENAAPAKVPYTDLDGDGLADQESGGVREDTYQWEKSTNKARVRSCPSLPSRHWYTACVLGL